MYTYVKGKGWVPYNVESFTFTREGVLWCAEKRKPQVGERYSWFLSEDLEGTTLEQKFLHDLDNGDYLPLSNWRACGTPNAIVNADHYVYFVVIEVR